MLWDAEKSSGAAHADTRIDHTRPTKVSFLVASGPLPHRLVARALTWPECQLLRAAPITRADIRAAIVKAKNGPKS